MNGRSQHSDQTFTIASPGNAKSALEAGMFGGYSQRMRERKYRVVLTTHDGETRAVTGPMKPDAASRKLRALDYNNRDPLVAYHLEVFS